MGLFGSKKEGGLMDVIRCDKQEYLVWKWRPSGEANSTNKENAIRFGSSLRVKAGEIAVFVYKQSSGAMHDYIVGPFDETIKTANFPVLTGIVGAAFGGASPFQAEIYFINLAGNNQIRFGVPYFDVFDPRFLDFSVPMAARGTLTFNITDYEGFIKLNRLINFELEDFQKQVKDAIVKHTKGVITNIPQDKGIPVLQMERQLLAINEAVHAHLQPRLFQDFGVNLKALDLASIDVDKENEGYRALLKVTQEQASKATIAQTDVNIKNIQDTQRIQAENTEELLRIQREEGQRAQKLQTETNFMGAHALNQQTEVLKTGAESLGNMGSMGGGDGSGLNVAGIMTGMAMGGALGGQMSQMMNQMGQQVNTGQNQPPPPPVTQIHVSINGQNSGPFTLSQLQQMVGNGQLNSETFVWKAGMPGWVKANEMRELDSLFGATPPPPPLG